MDNLEMVRLQKETCSKYAVPFVEARPTYKIGVAKNIGPASMPVNGLRHPQEGDTTGWYIWTGNEFPKGADAFNPVHVEHIDEVLPSIKKYLGLPPGWRFQIDDKGYEDVWEDKKLLEI